MGVIARSSGNVTQDPIAQDPMTETIFNAYLFRLEII